MVHTSGRDREVELIRQANRAAAMGRLILGEMTCWEEFLEADRIDLKHMPRRQLKSGKKDVKARLSEKISQFCTKNFQGMNVRKLSALYEEVKAHRGLEIPLKEFEARYAKVRKRVLKGNPSHLTVILSLWGLKFRFPEHDLCADILEGLRLAQQAESKLNAYEKSDHANLRKKRSTIQTLIRQKDFAARSTVLACFNLMECYLNGLAWDFMQTCDGESLSNRKRKLLDDSSTASIRDKLCKYPEIISGRRLWGESEPERDGFIDTIKPFRDSLVHPSPFSAPERFGGYDKIRLFFRVDVDTALMAAHTVADLIRRIHHHMYGKQPVPDWLLELKVQA